MKTAIVGLTWGDEGKGRVSAYFAKNSDWTIKFNGGANAGHSVYDEAGKLHKFHHLTAGAVYNKKIAIDAGSVVDLETLRAELDTLGYPVDLYVSEAVHMVSKDHLESDSGGSGVGSTKRGIAYVYSDRALRKGERITQKALDDHGIKATIYRGLPPVEKGEDVIFEGAQGLQLDIDYGDYPYVTSSSVMPSMIHKIDKTIGVFKAYTTRVGDGPPYWEDIESLRVAGDEFGVTTGRARRCTWNDMDQLNYAISIVQPDEIVVTKLDILKDLGEICVYSSGKLITIGDINEYKLFLKNSFPQIRWFSESPMGDLIGVR